MLCKQREHGLYLYCMNLLFVSTYISSFFFVDLFLTSGDFDPFNVGPDEANDLRNALTFSEDLTLFFCCNVLCREQHVFLYCMK